MKTMSHHHRQVDLLLRPSSKALFPSLILHLGPEKTPYRYLSPPLLSLSDQRASCSILPYCQCEGEVLAGFTGGILKRKIRYTGLFLILCLFGKILLFLPLLEHVRLQRRLSVGSRSCSILIIVLFMESLFDKCPVLPPDASISLARYLSTARQTASSAADVESSQPFRAALLHIRVVQLICKTIPSHSEYSLSENEGIVRELNEIAHRSFLSIERLGGLLDVASRKKKLRNIYVAAGVFDLFRRVAIDYGAKTFLGLLAGRVEDNGSNVSALVIPSQTAGSKCSEIRYESDVSQLLDVKGLSLLGLLHHQPSGSILPNSTQQLLLRCSERVPEAIGVLLSATDTYTLFSGTNGRIEEAVHAVVDDGHPMFKLYDLRQLAVARDKGKEQ